MQVLLYKLGTQQCTRQTRLSLMGLCTVKDNPDSVMKGVCFLLVWLPKEKNLYLSPSYTLCFQRAGSIAEKEKMRFMTLGQYQTIKTKSQKCPQALLLYRCNGLDKIAKCFRLNIKWKHQSVNQVTNAKCLKIEMLSFFAQRLQLNLLVEGFIMLSKCLLLIW